MAAAMDATADCDPTNITCGSLAAASTGSEVEHGPLPVAKTIQHLVREVMGASGPKTVSSHSR
jgi:hypothetical protein